MMNEKTENVQKQHVTLMDQGAAVSELRQLCTVLCAELSNPKPRADDDSLRHDIAALAARMLVLAARCEGEASPIPALLAQADIDCTSRSNLLAALRDIAPDLMVNTLA